MSDAPKGLVFNIQKFSLHDGPGIRTIVFLKGCPLACMWCSNPEGRSTTPELILSCDRCIGTDECDRCITVCLEGAISKGEDGTVTIDRARCDGCGDCTYVCPSEALETSGDWVEVEEVLRIVEEDDAFYARSGGGLTLSGGEPLAQGSFVRALLGAARNRGIDTAVETSGLCNWKTMKDVAPLTDRMFFDIKCLDPEKHERVTGVSNAKILDNFRKLRAELPEVDVVVRTPVIPGVNDSERDIRAIAEFVTDAGGASSYELLPYHRFGEPKYEKLGKHYRLSHLESPTDARMAELRQVAALA
ncbi:MAG: glycyl-radical enzyme activating protein [Myxococcales bacterium]|nr:MAG: glycyl-radical enzyme activating protein [Myxococcales bacterium]